MLNKILSFVALLLISNVLSQKDDLEPSESNQSYGYGYGTRVADQYGESTVYVHGFGTTNDDYHESYNEIPDVPPPVYEQPAYYAAPAPIVAPYPVKPHLSYPTYPKPYYSGYGYGQIDAYGNARHGYGFGPHGYAPGAVGAPLPPVDAPIPTVAPIAPPPPPPAPLPLKAVIPVGSVGVSHSLPPLPHGNVVAHPAPYLPSLSHGFGYGFSQF